MLLGVICKFKGRTGFFLGSSAGEKWRKKKMWKGENRGTFKENLTCRTQTSENVMMICRNLVTNHKVFCCLSFCSSLWSGKYIPGTKIYLYSSACISSFLCPFWYLSIAGWQKPAVWWLFDTFMKDFQKRIPGIFQESIMIWDVYLYYIFICLNILDWIPAQILIV